MDLKHIMRRADLFRGLNDAQLQQITTISHMEQYEKEAVIFTQGSDGDRMYIVGQGQVEVQVRDVDGTTYAAIYLGEGQIFGEMALVDEGKRSASVVAVEDNTIVYGVPSREFNALCQADNAIGYLMMRNIAQDLSFKLRHRDFDPSGS
jgi:CRP/FNR family transcriptional regulator, cyclic AMP receptor protein